jgi:uncharacterized protein
VAKLAICKRSLTTALAVFCLVALAGQYALALEVPAYHGYVNDYADMISPAMEAKLNQALQAFNLTDSTQVAVLTIPSLDGDALEDFSVRTASKWQIGQKNKDNGVLLLVSKNDHKIRIEVGRGLEPVLTDLLTGRIVDNLISPYFKSGRFDDGFASGVGAIIQASRGEFKGDGIRRLGRRRRAEPSPLLKFLFFGLALTAFLGSNSRRLGLLAGGLLFPLAFVFGLLPVGALLLLFLIPVGAFGGWLLPLFLAGMFRGGGYYGGGMGGFGGGGMGGGGFGGFGGGGFGGGGASGGW